MAERRTPLDWLRQPESATQLLVARIVGLILLVVVVTLVVGLAVYHLERNAPGTAIRSYGDALFWTSSQLTTVSSSLPNPITSGGRILAVGIDFISVAVVSLLFGSIAQHIHIVSPERELALRRERDEDERSKA